MKSLSIKGIILGVLSVLIIDLLSSIGLIPLFAPSMTPEALGALYANTGALIYSMFFGTISTVVGGFLVAKLSKCVPYKNALVFGIVGIFLGYFLSSGFPIWFNVLAFSTTIPAALLGAYIFVRKQV